MIPKIIHQFWDGPKQKPSELMNDWRDAYKQAGWEYHCWDAKSVRTLYPGNRLVNQTQFDQMPEWAGKADIARYEILNRVGGVFIDADSSFLRLIDESLLSAKAFCCFENEAIRPGLLSNGYLGSEPDSKLTRNLIQAINRLDGENLHPDSGNTSTELTEAWKSTGPVLLTKIAQRLNEDQITIHPSFYFIPNHYRTSHPAAKYQGDFQPYCDSLWASTPGTQYKYESKEDSQEWPWVSICTITSNREKFLPILLSCIERQEYPIEKLEWVILDDSPNDTCRPKLTSRTKLRIKHQVVSQKITLGHKRNIAHKLCSGEIIVYMDDDDFYPPTRVSHAVSTLRKANTGIAASTILPIFFTHDNQLWISGPFGRNHGTAGTFAMTREFARSHFYSNQATCNEEKDFLEQYTIPVAQLDPQLTMICISHSRNTFDKKRMRQHGATPRMRPAKEHELDRLIAYFSAKEYVLAAQ